jgi:uncharacterized membrane protein YeiH
MGVMTGVAGGVMRDLLCGDVPMILRQEIYATASLGGGVVYVLLGPFAPGGVPLIVASVVVFAARLAGIWWQLRLPGYELDESEGA